MRTKGLFTVAALGDSLFQGWGLDAAEAAPVVLERRLTTPERPVRVLNFGISGDTAADGLRRVDRVVRAEPDLALVEFGANDFYQGVAPEQMEQHLKSILGTLARNDIPALLVGIRALAEFTGQEYKERFDPVFERVAAHFSVPLLPDIFAAYLHDPEMLQPDGIHPNAAGAVAIAKYVEPETRAALARLDADLPEG